MAKTEQSPAKLKLLSEIHENYKNALEHYKEANFELAEKEFVEVLRPVLSKPSMQSLYVSIDDCKKELMEAMDHLGDIYLRSDKYLDHHSKAAAIFQYCAGFAKKYGCGNPEEFARKAYNVELEYLASIGKGECVSSLSAHASASSTFTTPDSSSSSPSPEDGIVRCTHAAVAKHKGSLGQIRADVRKKLDEIKDWPIEKIADRAKKVEEIYRDCTKFFVNNDVDKAEHPGLVQQLLSSCFEQLGPPPEGCDHAIIGLGSLAGGRMTPWSDLEFAILINEDNDEFKEYFRNLTKLLHIKVINIGETPLRSVAVEALNNFRTAETKDDWFWDVLTSNGFSFDGPDWHACKLPLGRQGKYKAKEKIKLENGTEREILVDKPDYELIRTPQNMAAFQKKADTTSGYNVDWFKSDIFLVQGLRLVTLIHGSQSLLDRYRLKVMEAVDDKVVKERALEKLRKDITNFSLKLGEKEEGKLIDVKKDIFRIGDRIIDDLTNYFLIRPDEGRPGLSAWEVIDKMAERGNLNEEGAQHLKEALSIATELRLATYCHNNGQSEGMSTYPPAVEHLSERQKQQLLYETFYLTDTSALHHFYYVMLSLQDIAEAFSEKKHHDEAEFVLSFDPLFDPSNHTKGMVHARFLEYDKALLHLKEANSEKPENLEILQDLFLLCYKSGKIDEAFQIANSIFSLIASENETNPNRVHIANFYNNLGVVYKDKTYYEAAFTHFDNALTIQKKIYGTDSNHPDIANTYNNLGSLYRDKGCYKTAIKYFNTALGILLKAYEHSPNHPTIADIYNNLGEVYDDEGNYELSVEKHKYALKIYDEAYKDSPNHTSFANTYCNLGVTYKNKGEYEDAIKYLNYALEIRRKVYEHYYTHTDIAYTYNNLGTVYLAKGSKESLSLATKYFKDALKIYDEAYMLNPNHPYIAGSYINLGKVSYAEKNYSAAFKYYDDALTIQKKIYGTDANHRDIATTYNNLGLIYIEQMGNHDLKMFHTSSIKQLRIINYTSIAFLYFNKALAIQCKVYGTDSNHPDIASSYSNLAKLYTTQGDYRNALKNMQKASKICLKVHEDNPNHPYIAISFSNLGAVYANKEDYGNAIKCLVQALKIYNHNQDHPNIAICNNILVKICTLCFKQSQLKTLADDYNSLGNHEKALEYFEKARDLTISLFGQGSTEVLDIDTKVIIDKSLLDHEKSKTEAAKSEEDILKLVPESTNTDSTSTSLVVTHDKELKRQITNFEDIPHKSEEEIRIVSYNILSDFWDETDETADMRHHWANRAPIVKKLITILTPDFICLQELSPTQAFELARNFSSEFFSAFLSQTPSEIKPTGAIAFGEEVEQWRNKFAGTPLIGTFISKKWHIAEEEIVKGTKTPRVGKFWLNEHPFDTPENEDRGSIDKGFGNMNTYRAVLWVKVENEQKQALYIFNSHYPLNGTSETRMKCAQQEMELIQMIVEDSPWVSAGDRNLIPDRHDTAVCNPEIAYKELVKFGHDIRDSERHYGTSITWLGFSYDEHKSEVDPRDVASQDVLDVMVSNVVAVRSFHHPGAFDPHTRELIPLSDAAGITAQNEGRYFASDHALIGADFIFYPDVV